MIMTLVDLFYSTLRMRTVLNKIGNMHPKTDAAPKADPEPI